MSVRSAYGAWVAESVTRKEYLGRTATTSRPGFGGAELVKSIAYDSAGRKLSARNADGSREFYAYDALGDRKGVIRVGAGQALQFDPDAFTLPSVIALDAYVVEETPSWKEEGDLGLSAHGVPTAWWDCAASVSHLPGQGAVTSSLRRVQLSGLSAACVARTVTTDSDGVSEIVSEALDVAAVSKTVTRVNVATGAFDASTLIAGVEVARTNSLGSSSAYTFDGFARQVSAERRAGARVLRGLTGYHDDGALAFSSEIDGSLTNGTAYSVRQYLESPVGAYSVTATDALGNETVRYYHPSGGGDPYRVEGAVYPTATARDADGRQSELLTWRDAGGQPDATRWHYDQATGLVTNKVYADGKGPVYAYAADGRLAMRAWARGVTSEYSRVELSDGSVTVTDHAGSTPDVTNRYDLAGRLVSVADGAGNRTLSYDAKGRLTAETNSLAAISWHYDALGRDAGYDLDLPGFAANTFSVRYGYDGHGRLDRVASALGSVTNVFVYSFLPGTSLVTSMTNSAGFGWSRTYEPNRNLIVAVSNFWGTSAVSSFVYENDALGRRTLRVDAAPALSATNFFSYNHRSEVTNAAMDATSYSYAYDDIGNRRLALSNAVACTYSANELNQYYGVTNAGAWLPVTYDSDGNMTRLGGRYYAWDAENNMRRSGPLVNSNGNVRVDNAYDYKNRRVSKTVSVLTGYIPFTGIGQPFSPGEWVPSNTTHYVWDGWNIAAEIQIDCGEGTTNVHYYTWGLDLSGSIQGAGGVGGLLDEVRDSGTFFPCGDANGNVSEYVDATGAVRGHFEYSAFGEVAAQSGDLSDTFTHRFSTKPFDEETGISKYQQRDYIPPLGRWASRDPIGEADNENLYALLANKVIGSVDFLGLSDLKFIVGGNLNTEHGDGVSGNPTAIVQESYLKSQIQLAIDEYNKENDGNCALEIEYALSSSTIPMTLERLKSELYSPAGTGSGVYVLIFHGRRIRELRENKKSGLREVVVGETGLVLIDEVRKDTGFTTPFAVGRPYRVDEIFNSETELADTAKDFYVSCCYSAKLRHPVIRGEGRRFMVLGKATDARTSVGESILEIKAMAKELCCRKNGQSK